MELFLKTKNNHFQERNNEQLSFFHHGLERLTPKDFLDLKKWTK